MKNTNIPQALLDIPKPWSLTSNMNRKKHLQVLAIESEEIKIALNVLEQCLQALAQLNSSSVDAFPESLIDYWELSAEQLAKEIPSLKRFDVAKVKTFLQDQGIDTPTNIIVNETTNYWLWWIAKDTGRAALIWISDALRETKDAQQTSQLLAIASRYWSKIDEQFAQSLLSRCAILAGRQAIPLLKSVEQEADTPESIKKTARDYRGLIN